MKIPQRVRKKNVTGPRSAECLWSGRSIIFSELYDGPRNEKFTILEVWTELNDEIGNSKGNRKLCHLELEIEDLRSIIERLLEGPSFSREQCFRAAQIDADQAADALFDHGDAE